MLNVNTLPNRKDEEFDFDYVKRRRKTKDEQRRSKEQKKEEYFKTNVLVPKTNSMRKEEGAAVDSSAILPYLSSAGSFVRAGRAAFFHGVLQTIGKTSLTTENVLPSKRT